MVSVWSSSCSQRSISASSISSISSKIPLATASFVSVHNLSTGCSSGEPEGRNSRCIPSGTSTSPPVCHPARSTTKSTRLSLPALTSLANSLSAIENSSTLTVWARSATTPLRSRAARNRRGRSTCSLSCSGQRVSFPPAPIPALSHRLQAQARLILGPKLHLLGLRMSLPDLLQPLRESFLKASRSEASAPWALDGLGTWGLWPTFLRYSQPRWTCTFSNPVLCSIQRATFGPLHIPPPKAAGGGP